MDEAEVWAYELDRIKGEIIQINHHRKFKNVL